MLLVGLGSPDLRAQDAPIDRGITLVAEIGGAVGAEEYTFHRISDIAVAEDGRVYVLDGGDKTVRAYDSEGRFLVRFGREGGGPGEFSWPVALALGAGQVRVLDAARRRTSIFTRDGELLGTSPYPPAAPRNTGHVFPLRDDLLLAVTSAQFSLRGERDPHVRLALLGADVDRLDTIAEFRSAGVLWYETERRLPWGVATGPFGEAGAWALSGDSLLALVDGYAGRVSFYAVDDGAAAPGAVVDLGRRGRPLTDRDLDAFERELRAQRRVEGRPLPPEVGFMAPERWSVVTGRALFASDGTLWVEANDRADDGRRWWRIAPEQRVIPGSVRLPAAFRLEAVCDGRLFGVWRSDLDVQTVRVYHRARG